MPKPIQNYFVESNSHNIYGVVSCFAEDAVVLDEKKIYKGTAAISRWNERLSLRYRTTSKVLDVNQADDLTIVKAQVSGKFPGSPTVLKFKFQIQDGKISKLECGD